VSGTAVNAPSTALTMMDIHTKQHIGNKASSEASIDTKPTSKTDRSINVLSKSTAGDETLAIGTKFSADTNPTSSVVDSPSTAVTDVAFAAPVTRLQGKPGFQPDSKAPLAIHIHAPATFVPVSEAAVVGTSVDPLVKGWDALASDSASKRVAAATDEQATDALAAEALDATDGVFPSVADAIEAANLGSGTNAIDMQACRKPGFRPAPKAPLPMHIQASATSKCLDQAGAADSGGRLGVQISGQNTGTHTQASTNLASHPDVPALESGSRPSSVSTPRREPHPFLTTENARAYAQDPRMEGLLIALDAVDPSNIQNLPWDVFLTPRERGASLQEEYMAADYAAKQLRDGDLIRRVCDDWNYNFTNSYTPNDLRHGPITVWPQGRVTPAMRASYGDLARFWSKQVWLVADVPMEFWFFNDDAAAEVDEWRPRPTPFLPQAAVADAVAARLARALALTPPRSRSPTYQDFVASDREQAASSEQASALDLTLAGIVIGPTTSEYNPSAFPTFTEWDKVKHQPILLLIGPTPRLRNWCLWIICRGTLHSQLV